MEELSVGSNAPWTSGPRPVAVEAVELARRLEERAARFYREASRVALDEASARTFKELAEMEAQHEQVFAVLRGELPVGPSAEEFRRELQILSHTLLEGLTQDLADRFDSKRDPQSILREAMEFEKDTIVFCVALKDMIVAPAGKAKIDQIIREELGHLLLLGSSLTRA